MPTFTASGGLADIECFDTDCNPLVEVTLMCARNQATNEIPAITRHLNEAIANYPEITIFTIFVAPSIHADTRYMAEFSKYRDNVDIIPMTVEEFIEKLQLASALLSLFNSLDVFCYPHQSIGVEINEQRFVWSISIQGQKISFCVR